MPAPKDPEKFALWKQRLSDSHKGHRPSAETRAKIGAASRRTKLGKPRPDMQGANHFMHRPEVAAKVGAAHRGKPKSAAQRAKIAATLRGRYAGPKNPSWQGEEVDYFAVHQRANRVLPRQCAECGSTEGILDCALRHDAPPESLRTAKNGCRYSVAWPPDSGYVRLCRSCHKSYDHR